MKITVLALSTFVAILLTGCKTVDYSEESFAIPFEGEKVARLAHECYQLAWDARFAGRDDFRFVGYRPSPADWETLFYLDEISKDAPWIATDIKKNPTNPRRFSKASYDLVAFNLKMLKVRYRPASFRPSTAAKIDELLRLTDEISGYYKLKT